MAQAPQVFRYRPALVFIATAAAAIGAYKIYTTITEVPAKPDLHRSNAVHRNRARRPPVVELTAPSPDRPLGVLSVRQGSFVFEHDLHSGALPARELISQAVGSVSEDFYARIMQQAVYAVVLNCSPLNIFGLQSQVTRPEFSPLIRPLQVRNVAAMRRVRNVLEEQLPNVNIDIIDSALHDFMLVADPESSVHQQVAGPEDVDSTSGDGGQGITGLLYYIAEENAGSKAYEHRGISCESCGDSPICGIRWHCLNCPDYDLCSTCETMMVHPKTHVFVKIKIPIPVLSQPSQLQQPWYPGDPQIIWPLLPQRTKNMLLGRHEFQEHTIDALYDQFSCLANVPTPPDDTGVEGGIDIRAFRKALTPERWPQRFAPNAIFDRMFAFYDVEEQGFIGFANFVGGMAYLRGPQRFESLTRALQGFDIDGDGYVDRADFLRLFRAKFVLVRQLVSDMVDAQKPDEALRAMSTLRSSQPISSLFRDDEIPHGEVRRPTGKQPDIHGDLIPPNGIKTILDEQDPWPAGPPLQMRDGPQGSGDMTGHDRLRHQLSRFGEMLNGDDEDESGRFTMRSRLSEGGAEHHVITSHDDSGAARAADEAFIAAGVSVAATGNNTTERLHPGIETSVDVLESQPEVDQDALWQVVEQGFNDMLDPLFSAKEQQHREAIDTRAERMKWRFEIDQVAADRRVFRAELKSGSQVDALMATALTSQDTIAPDRPLKSVFESPFRAELVPTDTYSLEQREAEIADRSLDNLLDTAGYGTVDGSQNDRTQDDADRCKSSADLLASDDIDNAQDPTMPQHRPDSERGQRSAAPQSDVKHKNQTIVDSKRSTAVDLPSRPLPSPQRLLRLAELHDVETDIKERGGAGRLTIDEVEQMVEGDATKELRGLVIGWLDWASF
ncbi:hypothetical protein LTR86_007934 [Recurvomyces mirabilis]|nr:hypothetical protein LTR86_007934 [Recurvomyces mirabilis]